LALKQPRIGNASVMVNWDGCKASSVTVIRAGALQRLVDPWRTAMTASGLASIV
jgi:hypothetical protein